MIVFTFLFGFLLSFIANKIKSNKTYIPKDENCPTDVKDAKGNKMWMRIFSVLGPLLIVTGIVLLACGIGTEF
jgi:cytochrome b subunit of formate dehydrogenase